MIGFNRSITRIFCTVLVLVITLSLNVSAYNTELCEDFFEISGKTTSKNEIVTLLMLKDGEIWNDESWSSGDSGVIFFGAEQMSAEDKSYSFKVPADNSGRYNLYISKGKEQIPTEETIVIINKNRCVEAINNINNANGDVDSIATVLRNYKNDLSIFHTGFDELEHTKIAQLLVASLGNDTLKNDSDKACMESIKLILETVIAESFNERKNSDVNEYVDEMSFSQYDWYLYYNSSASNEITQRLASNTYTKTDDFMNKLREAVLLEGINHADGYGVTKNILKNFASYFDIDSLKVTDSVSRKITGLDFSNYASAKQKFNDIVSSESVSSGGASSGGGGGGGKVLSPMTITGMEGNTVVENLPQEQEDVFSDLKGFEWANEAIEDLYFKGVIAGKSQTEFCPGDFVKREEFVKMIVEAFELTGIISDPVVFNDVKQGEWYYDYICKAKTCKIVNGFSDDVFGIGNNISRQDIVVMCINAAKACNVNFPQNETSDFKDINNVSDYALDAVKTFQKSNIINGDEKGYFNPKNYATRAEAAKIIFEIMKLF